MCVFILFQINWKIIFLLSIELYFHWNLLKVNALFLWQKCKHHLLSVPFQPTHPKKISYMRSMRVFGSVIDRTFFYQFRSPHVFLKYQLVWKTSDRFISAWGSWNALHVFLIPRAFTFDYTAMVARTYSNLYGLRKPSTLYCTSSLIHSWY